MSHSAATDSPFGPHRGVRYLLTWALAIGFAVGLILHAHFAYEEERPEGDPQRRRDSNPGHTAIDFGGQWVMGRMLTSGHGRQLYHRWRQRGVTETAYSRINEAPAATDHDADRMLVWFMGQDDPRWVAVFAAAIAPAAASDGFSHLNLMAAALGELQPQSLDPLVNPKGPSGIGGPLYPPLHAFIMAPFALDDDPQRAYFTMQWLQLALAFLTGLGVSWMTRRRIWWPAATALILVYPGFRGTIDLGQNSATTLCLLVWGWAFIVRGHPACGGILWGLLAYKPVWALSFFLVLPLLRQWRAAVAMALTGVVLILATLPFVGVQTWLDWLYVGKQAAAKYNVDFNWINLSRDLFGIPRRFFIDFSLPLDKRDNPLATMMSWALWLLVVEFTLRVRALHGKREIPLAGPVPAFILLAAWLCTYRFMYYDALISVLGVFVLFADPRPYLAAKPLTSAVSRGGKRSLTFVNSFPLTLVAALVLVENALVPLKIEVTAELGYVAALAPEHERSTISKPKLVVGSGDHYPWDTTCVLLIWLWCGLRALALKDGSRIDSA